MNEKDLYLQKLKAQLFDWQIHVENLQESMAGISIGAKYELNQHIAMLEAKIKEGKNQIKKLSSATDESWEIVKASVDEVWESISEVFKEAYKEFMD